MRSTSLFLTHNFSDLCVRARYLNFYLLEGRSRSLLSFAKTQRRASTQNTYTECIHSLQACCTDKRDSPKISKMRFLAPVSVLEYEI